MDGQKRTPLGDETHGAADEMAIRSLLAQLAHAQDDGDRSAIRACFTESVLLTSAANVENWTPKEISVDELVERLLGQLNADSFTNHVVVNHIIHVDGDEATCSADLLLMSGRRGDDGQPSIRGGRYTMALRREEGEWKIFERGLRMRY